MNREDIVQVVRQRNDGVSRRDIDLLRTLYAEDGVVESLVAGRVKGRNAIGDVYEAWFKAFPDVVFTMEAPIVDADKAVEAGSVAGTDLGGFMGLPPTNKPFKLAMVYIYTFHDGLIVHERRIYDFTGLLVQIGVLKAKPA